jgi:hypothetical protein
MDDQSKFKELLGASHAGDEAKIKAALAEGFKVNTKDDLGRTLLMFAAESGCAGIVKILLGSGAKLDIRDHLHLYDSGGRTALHRAAAKNHVEVIKALLAAGANVDLTDKSKITPLAAAFENAETDDVTTAEILLEAGANPNGSEEVPTPLSMVVSAGFLNITKLLLRHGADPNHPADSDRPVLGSTYVWCHLDICRVLLNAGANVNARDDENRTLLDVLDFLIAQDLWTASQLEAGIDKDKSRQIRRVIRAMLIEAGAKPAEGLAHHGMPVPNPSLARKGVSASLSRRRN